MLNNIKESLLEHEKELISILSELETETVAFQEIKLCINALDNSEKYNNKKVEQISSYLPMNLPLYSLMIYVIIPKICSNRSYYKPSSKTINISKRIHELLNLNEYNIHLFEGTRSDFNEDIVKLSNVAVFVGKPKNAQKILKNLPPTTLFLYFGVGQNPAVITEGADLSLAGKKIAASIMFNYGQDCAKPNVILCKRELYPTFKRELLTEISKLMKEKTTIKNIDAFKNVINLLIRDREFLVQGGNVDIKNMTLDPIVVTRNYCDLESNYEEYYAPVFRIMLFENENDLKKYFSSVRYREESMAVSLFGRSNYIEKLPTSLILNNEVVTELDNGFSEFGGYGKNASYLSYEGITISKPLLINREIDYFYNNNCFLKNKKNIMSATIKNQNDKNLRNLIIDECTNNIKMIFKDDLEFSFIFGSYAKNKENPISDIDLFICLNRCNEKSINEFRKWYFKFHYMFGKFPDVLYPGEILSVQSLENILNSNADIILKDTNNSEIFDLLFYTQIFTDKKILIAGNQMLIDKYRKEFEKNIQKYCKEIFEFLLTNSYFKDERGYGKALVALANNDLLYLSKQLKFEQPEQIYRGLVKKMDDGFFTKYVYKKQLLL